MTTIKMITTLAIAATTLLLSCGGTTTKSDKESNNETTQEQTSVRAVQYDFRVVLPGSDLSGFDALILPNGVTVSDEEAARLNAFSGAILFFGKSLVKDGKFLIDAGCEYVGESAFELDYFRAEDALGELWIKAPFI